MKKITFALLALVCALCCAFGFAACSNPADKTVKGSAVGNDCIRSVELCREGGTQYDILFNHTNYKNGESKQYRTGRYTIQVLMYNRYGIGNMKMLVNGTEAELTLSAGSQNSALDVYECEYDVNTDFEITFSGAAERKTAEISVVYTADDWQDRIDESFALQVRLLVNGNNAAAPFQNGGELNSVSLERFIELIADNSITVKADDRVDIYVFSTLSKYKVNSGVLGEYAVAGVGSTLNMKKEAFTDDLGRKGYHYQFDVKTLQASLRLSTHQNSIAVLSGEAE